MKIKFYVLILSILLLETSKSSYLYSMNSLTDIAPSNKQKNVTNIYDDFKKDYLANFEFSKEKKEKVEIITTPQPKRTPFKVEFKLDLSEGEKRKIILELFSKIEAKQNIKYEQILSKTFTKDIELFNGILFKKLNYTTTIPGEIELAKILITPTCNINTLKKRQELIKRLNQDEDLFNKINTELQKFNENQNIIISFSNSLNASNAQSLGMLYSQFNIINRSPLLLGSTTYLLPLALFLKTVGAAAYTSHALNRKNIDYLGAGTGGMFTLICALGLVAHKSMFITIKSLQSQLISLRNGLDSLKGIHESIKNISIFKQVIPEISNIDQLLNQADKKSYELKKLVELLSTNTFKEVPSIFSHGGRILVAYKLINEINEQFGEAYQALGKIDAFMSLVKLYKSYQNKRVKFAYANYINSNYPEINIKDFHHPIIDPNIVISNSVNFGTQSGIRTAIITGPNAGGKSTVLKSILICLLLAQTVGIVPASSMDATIFNKICSYMNITDDIKANQSLFMAEAIRAIELLKLVDSDQKVFVASDEIFTGTDPIEGSAAAYAFAEEATMHPNTILMLATHYPLLTQLEKETAVAKNFMVKVNKIEEGKIIYPFQLEPGKSHQKVAIDILRIQGLKSRVLDRAQKLIEKMNTENNY